MCTPKPNQLSVNHGSLFFGFVLGKPQKGVETQDVFGVGAWHPNPRQEGLTPRFVISLSFGLEHVHLHSDRDEESSARGKRRQSQREIHLTCHLEDFKGGKHDHWQRGKRNGVVLGRYGRGGNCQVWGLRRVKE